MSTSKSKEPKPKKQKKLRGVLAQPIEYDLNLLFILYAKEKGMPLPQGEPFNDAVQTLKGQLAERYRALFEFYSISPSTPDAQFWLIIRMAMELFPSAFNYVRHGEKKRGNKKKWTTSELLRLWALVQKLRADDPSLDDKGAAKRIADENFLIGPPTAPQSVQQRYSAAKRMMKRFRTEPLSPFEAMEFADFLESLQPGALNDLVQ